MNPKPGRTVENPMASRNVAAPGAAQSRDARPAPPVTAAYLERAALHYLERYSASVAMLRRTLARRVEKRCRLRGEDAAAFAAMVEATVERAVKAGLVDDARFTTARLATLRRRGTSARAVGAKLAAKGIGRAMVAAVLEAEREGADATVDAEEAAARAYARRRRLGPWRRPEARAAHRDKDLAALGRAGFPYALARRIVEAETGEEGGAEA